MLEGRRLLTTVTTPAGLIAAINAANAAGGSHAITLGANITLLAPDNYSSGENGLPAIASGDNLTINGNGHTIQRSYSVTAPVFRFFYVASGGTLSLKSLSLKNGLGFDPSTLQDVGGAIYVVAGGTLNMSGVILSGNSASNLGDPQEELVEGGALYNAGTANITASIVINNSAVFKVAILAGSGNDIGSNDTTDSDEGNGANSAIVVSGGGIFSTGSLTISASSVSNNSALCNVTNGSLKPTGGVGNGNNNGDSEDSGFDNNGVDNGNEINNSVTLSGGGIYTSGSATLKNDVISGNRAALTVLNGSDNGDNNGDNDSADNCGDNNGNGVEGDANLSGGGVYNQGDLTASGTSIVLNSLSCSVTNGSNNGDDNGQMTENFNGNNNGNGVDGNIVMIGGGLANDSGSTAQLNLCSISSNSIVCNITNGNNNGDGDGENNAGLGNNEGKNNGNAVAGFVHISGGGIDNESTASLTVTNSVVVANAIHSTITNGNGSGNMDGNNDGDGDALASTDNSVDVLVLHGGGIYNGGAANLTLTVLSANSISSSIRNGNNDGNSNGNDNAESNDGRANGNCVSGDVLIAGGGIANSNQLTASKIDILASRLTSTIANGSQDGDNDGNDDGSFDNCGINGGNAVFGDVEVDGGGLGNSGTATIGSSVIAANLISSTVTNGKGNGDNDGTNSTGSDGQGDGNGVDGNVEVIGGGTANAAGATLTLNSTSVTGNSISSKPTAGSNDPLADGDVVSGTVTVSGANRFSA
jgi:hypothetical protein